jgi:GNAT superfamily N-acetyltransferase
MPSLRTRRTPFASVPTSSVFRRPEFFGSGVTRASATSFRYAVEFLATEHVDQVWRLQQTVLAPLAPPLPLYVRDRDFFRRCIEGVGCVVGAFHHDRLIAYATLHAPQRGEDNLGIDLGLPERDLPFVAHLAGSAVDPVYRGNRLQSRLVGVREEFARRAGFRHLCGEVVPGNSVSIRNHLSVGYRLKAFRIDRLGDPNFVLDKELHPGAHSPSWVEWRESATDDVPGFRRMMRAGLWGFRTVNRSKGMNIVFGRFAHAPAGLVVPARR